MSGAGFLLTVNFLIAQCFCLFFLAVSARSRNRVAARWFAGCFAVASLSTVFELLVAYVDGQLAQTIAGVTKNILTGNAFIGRSPDSLTNFFNGDMAEVRSSATGAPQWFPLRRPAG